MADATTSLAAEETAEFTGKKFRVAMIGCGGIAQVHLKAYKLLPEVEIVAAVDIDEKMLTRMKETWNLPEEALFTDWKKMLEVIKPDGVDICTPNGVHAAPTIDAANAGCHVIVEKPMAMNTAQCEEMIAAAKANNVKLTVGFQHRYRDNITFLTNARDQGVFGDIMFVKVKALRRRGIPNWGVFGQKELQGGGPMIDIGVHMIEAAHYLMGEPTPVAASGNTWTYIGDKPSDVDSMWPNWDFKTYTVEDLAIGQIRFDNGAIMQIETSFCAHVKEDVHNFTFMGTKAGGSFIPAEIYTDFGGSMMNMTPGFLTQKNEPWDVLFAAKIQNWVESATKGTPQRASGETGLAIQKILNGIYDSAAAGKEIDI